MSLKSDKSKLGLSGTGGLTCISLKSKTSLTTLNVSSSITSEKLISSKIDKNASSILAQQELSRPATTSLSSKPIKPDLSRKQYVTGTGSHIPSSGLASGLSLKSSLLGSSLKSPSLASSLGQKNVQPRGTRAYGTSSLLGSQQTRAGGISSICKPSLSSNLLSSSLTSSVSVKGATVSTTTKSQGHMVNVSLSSQVVKPHSQLSSSLSRKTDEITKSLSKEKKRRENERSSGKKSRSKRVKKEAPGLAEVVDYESIEKPIYNFDDQLSDVEEMEIPEFVPPEQDEQIVRLTRPVHDIEAMKKTFINAVSGSLIRAPDFKECKDPTRLDLIAMADQVSFYDAEFILKVALYTRKGLNIRSTANFLLSYCAYNRSIRPYIRKYYKACINLPSDWIDVAEQYQVFYDKSLNFGSLPAALRRSMIAKFPDFDQYQLGKYNKDSSGKKKKKKGEDGDAGKGGGRDDRDADGRRPRDDRDADGRRGRGGRVLGRGRGVGRGRGRGRGGSNPRSQFAALDDTSSSSSDDSSDDGDEDAQLRRMFSAQSGQSETEEELARRTFTLKQLIRKLHITEPVENVMCLIGKKYPDTLDEFYQARLPGTFDEERAGKRMKLPTPETWETQVSSKGNKASTWEALIDHKKLPFMAMLRNLRNMIKAGISQKHHTWVVKKLTDEGAVANSRQFPFRFFSAYQVLEQLETDYDQNQQDLVDAAVAATSGLTSVRGGRGRGRGRGGRGGRGGKGGGKGKKEKQPEEVPYDKELVQRYRKALDTSVKIATVHNVTPIKGTTIILCNLGNTMNRPCRAARGLGKPRQISEIAVLMGLMCKYSCEESQFIVYGSGESRGVELEKGTILNNMDSVLRMQSLLNNSTDPAYCDKDATIPKEKMLDLLRDRVQIDNIIILSDGMNLDNEEGVFMTSYLKRYRRIVNPNLLFVSIDLSGSSCGFTKDIQPGHDNDIFIAGYSDQILRFIAERGDGGQLIHVENIDKSHNLIELPKLASDNIPVAPAKAPATIEKPLSISFVPRWRTARVFISSTFRDMHGERDLLTRFVFPELRARAAKKFINISEVDLRWGVTEEETKSNKALEICLSEVARCQLFIGMLGERYGWVPDKYTVPDTPQFDWVREYQAGASVTELEMYSAALCKPDAALGKAFFYFRDSTFAKDIPEGLAGDFMVENEKNTAAMEKLKGRIRTSGLEVYDNYPCQWGGVVDGRPVVVGLDQFGYRVLNNMWNAILLQYPDEDAVVDELTHESGLHEAFMEKHRSMFVGRKGLMKQTMTSLREHPTGVHVLHGKPGSGKSAFMAKLVHSYTHSKLCDGPQNTLIHCMGATPGSTNITATLRRLCQELKRRFSLLNKIPEDYKNLGIVFEEMLGEASNVSSSPLALFIDGADLLEDVNQAKMMLWLPENLPQNVLIVVSVKSDTEAYKSLMLKRPNKIQIGNLELLDKADVVREMLAVHRKQLDESPFNNQMKLLVAKKEANVPLYLSLACEELRVYGLFEKMKAKLMSLPHTVPQLLQEILLRLEQDHGHELVRTVLCLLVCARHGITEEELRGVLNLHSTLGGSITGGISSILNMQPTPETSIPAVTFSKLLRAIQGFLRPNTANSTNHLSLAHADIEVAIRQRYFKAASGDSTASLHQLIAGYYYMAADSGRDGTFEGKNDRAFSELPYHLVCGGCYKELEDVLTSLPFIYAKSHLGLAPQILEDFQPIPVTSKLSVRDQQKFFAKPTLDEYKSFVSRNLHILTGHPALTWQQALNEPATSGPAIDIRNLLAENKVKCSLMEWTNKPEIKDPCIITINNIPEVVTCISISPDGQYFACGSKDCVVRTYELATGKEVKTFTGHASEVTDVCFAGSNRLCSASADSTLSLWDAHSGHRIEVLKRHRRRVNSCSSDKSGKHIVSVGWDCGIYIWNAMDGKSLGFLKGDDKPVNCVAFHPEGQLVVTGHWDSAIRIFDVWHRTRKAVLRGHTSSVRDVAYSPSGRHIASASLDGDVKLWSATQGSQVGNIRGHSLPINRLTFSASGLELITVADDHKVKVWSGHLGKLVSTMEDVTEEWGAVTSVDIHQTGEVVLAGYHSGHVRQFDLLSGLLEWEKQPHDASVTAIKYNKDGSRFLTGSEDMNIRAKVMNASDESDLAQGLKGHTQPITSVAYGEQYLVSTSHDCTILLYNLPSSQLRPNKPMFPICTLQGHSAPISCCSFNSTETRLATGSRDMSLYIWDISDSYKLRVGKTAPERQINSCHSDWVNSCCWSDTGDFIVTGGNDFNLKLWDTKTGEEKVSFTGHQSAITSVAYSYGCIVSSSADGLVKVWSHRGTEITTLHGHSQRVNSCAIHVDVSKTKQEAMEPGEITCWAAAVEEEVWKEQHDKTKLNKKDFKVEDVIVASASDDGSVRLWQPLESNEIACFTGHSDRVLSVETAKNGTICTSSLDKTLKEWESPQQAMEVMAGHNGEITSIVISRYNKYMVTTARDGTLKLWVFNDVTQEGVPRLAYTVKADTRSVNAVCFAAFGQQSIITGSDSGMVKEWMIVETSRGVFLRKSTVVQLAYPVTSVSLLTMEEPYNITVTGWAGRIDVVDMRNGSLRKTGEYYHGHSKTERDWVLCARHLNPDKPMYVAGGIDETVEVWTNSSASAYSTIRIPYMGDVHLPKAKRNANWLTSLAGDSNAVFVGDVHGQLTKIAGARIRRQKHGSDIIKPKRVHSSAISSCVFEESKVFTASKDQTIKVWSSDLRQVGQFFGQSPFTSLAAGRSSGNAVRLVAGDQLGNLSFLNWKN